MSECTTSHAQITCELIVSPGQFSVKSGHAPFPPDLIAFTRVFTASPRLLGQWNDLDGATLREVLMSEKLYQRDVNALEFLENRCTLLLQPYKTTLEVSLLIEHQLKGQPQIAFPAPLPVFSTRILNYNYAVVHRCYDHHCH